MITWEYIAGFFDGEGSIVAINKHSLGNYRISMAQNTITVLNEIKGFLDNYGVHSWITEKTNGGYHLAFSASDSVRLFLESTLPYLIVKRQKALDALEKLTKVTKIQPTNAQYTAAKELLKIGFSYRETQQALGVKFAFTTLKRLMEDYNTIHGPV